MSRGKPYRKKSRGPRCRNCNRSIKFVSGDWVHNGDRVKGYRCHPEEDPASSRGAMVAKRE